MLGGQQDRVETILSVVDNYTREIERYRNDLNSVTKEVAKFNSKAGNTSGVEKLFASLGGLKGILAGLGIAVSIKEIGKLGLGCINAASEIKELDNVLEQVFERGQESVVKWADSVSTNIGRASFAMQQNASIFGAMFKGAGIKTDDLHDMSLDLAQLAADFSSFYDGPMQEVFNAIKSGITGETEPLKRYGIILNETTAAEYALSQGIKTKWREMSEAQKQIVRYNFLMDKTKFVQGDAERTIDSYANQVKVLEAYFDNISRTLGQKFIPAGEDVLHVVNNMMGAIDGWINRPNIDNYLDSFYEEKSQVESLYAEYEFLSEKTAKTTEEKERMVNIIETLQSMYPGYLDNIDKDSASHTELRDRLQEVVSLLKSKAIAQLTDDMTQKSIESMKTQSKELNSLNREYNDYFEDLERKLKKKYNLDLNAIFNVEKLPELKNIMDKIKSGEVKYGGVGTVKLEEEINKLAKELAASQNLGWQETKVVESSFRSLMEELAQKTERERQSSEKYQNSLVNIKKDTIAMEQTLSSLGIDLSAMGIDLQKEILGMEDTAKKQNTATRTQIAEKTGKLSGEVRGAKDQVLGQIDGSKEALTMEMIDGFFKTNEHITIIGSDITTTIRKGLNGIYSMTQVNSQTGIKSEQDVNAQRLEATLHGLGVTKNKIDFDGYKGTGGSKTGSTGSKSKNNKEKRAEKDKWEQMLESLNKQIKEFSITSQEVAGKIKNARTELDKLEISKIIDFRDALDWSNAEVLQSFIKIKETSRDLARTLGDKGAVEQYTQEIKKLNEQLYFANTGKDYKKKTEEIQYDIKSDNNKEVYNELIKNIEEYISASKSELDKRYSEGLDDENTYLDKQLKLFEGIEETFDKLGLANEKLSAVIEKDRIQREKSTKSIENDIEKIRYVGKLQGKTDGEIEKEVLSALEKYKSELSESIYKNDTLLNGTLNKQGQNIVNAIKDNKDNEISKETPKSEEKDIYPTKQVKLDKYEIEGLVRDKNKTEKNIQELSGLLKEYDRYMDKKTPEEKNKLEESYDKQYEQLLRMIEIEKDKIELYTQMITSKEKTVKIHGSSVDNLAESKGNSIVGKKDGEILSDFEDRAYKAFKGFNDYLAEKYPGSTGLDFSKSMSLEAVENELVRIEEKLELVKGKTSPVAVAEQEVYAKLYDVCVSLLNSNESSNSILEKNIKSTEELREATEKDRKSLEKTDVQILETKEAVRIGNLEDNFQKGIEDLFLNINASDIQGSLISGVRDLFDKAVQGTDISGIYNKKFSEAFGRAFEQSMEGYTPTGNYLKDQEEQQKRFIEALRELATSSDSAVRSIANLTLFDTVKGQLDELAQHLSNAGEVLKDDFLKNLAVTVESLSALAESLKNTSLTSNSKLGGMLGGIGGFLSNVTSGIGMVTGLVTTGVGLARSVGNVLGFGSSKKQKAKNEEEKKKAAEWYEKQFKENTDLIKSINDLTGSIVDLNTKLIQNIASNTSDKNISKQKNYYDNLIKKTGDLFDENITATGHSTSKKKKLFGSKTTDSYSTLNQGFDEYFGDAWKFTARDSKSLEQFYDSYLKNFDMNVLKQKLGKNSIDNSNIDEVKTQFLRFIEDIKTMETHSKKLPKNGILESFDGVEVVDVFELRNEYQKQLENIYKGMGKDPEKYKEEILQQVNALIQEGEMIISAFNDVKSTFYGKVIEGDSTIMSLGTGLESYFTKLRTNISKVFYDINFQGLEESFNNKFSNISDKLADFRLSGGNDLSGFVNNNLNFWDEFTQLKSTENIKNDMKEVLDILKAQAKGAGLSDDVINAMFPDSAIDDKANDIKSALEKAMRDALDTNSFSQFSMSLGDSIYNNVKDGLIEAFYESETFKGLAEKYFLNDDYTKALEGAGSFKDAYDIMKAQLDKAEIQLQAEGLDFRGTNSSSGEYYGGLSNSYKSPTGLLANDIIINYTLNNYGFLEADDFLKKMVKTIKEELHESKKKEV